MFLGAVGEFRNNYWLVKIVINNDPLEFHIDTGAKVSVISEEEWKDW